MVSFAGPLLLLLVGPVLLFPDRFPLPVVLASLGLLLAPFILRRATKGVFIAPTPLNLPILLLLVVALPVTLWVTPLFWQATWPKLTSLLWAMAVFFEVVNWPYEPDHQPLARPAGRRIAWLTLVYLALGSAFTVVGLLGLGDTGKLPFLGQITIALPNLTGVALGLPGGIQPNEVAGTLTLFAPLALALSLALLLARRREEPERITFHPLGLAPRRLVPAVAGLSLLLALFFTGVLLLTQSRSGLLGFGLALVLMLLLMGRRGWILLGGLSVVGLATFLVAGPQRLIYIFLYASSSSWQYGSVGLRLEIWQRALRGIADFPLTGIGLGTFRHALNFLYPWPQPKGETTAVLDLDLAHAHNLFLQTALDLGLPAMLIVVAIVAITLVCLARLFRRVPAGSPDRYWVIGLTGALTAHLVFSLTDTIALGARPGVGLWFLLGLTMAAFSQTRTTQGQPAGEIAPARRVRPGIMVAGLGLLLLALVWLWLRPAARLNRVATQATAALLAEPELLPAVEATLSELARYNCHANWYWGLVLQAQQNEAGRDGAWSVLLQCTDRFTPYVAILAPDHQALAEFAVQVQPESAAAHFWLAGIQAEQSPALAVELYRQGLRLTPGDGLRWLELGDLLVDSDRQAAIAAYLEACRHGDPAGNGCWRAGQTAEMEGDVTAAVAYYRQSHLAKALDRAAQLESGALPGPRSNK